MVNVEKRLKKMVRLENSDQIFLTVDKLNERREKAQRTNAWKSGITHLRSETDKFQERRNANQDFGGESTMKIANKF